MYNKITEGVSKQWRCIYACREDDSNLQSKNI